MNKDIETYTYTDGWAERCKLKRNSLFTVAEVRQEAQIVSGKVIYDGQFGHKLRHIILPRPLH
jgi:hypothetical protein